MTTPREPDGGYDRGRRPDPYDRYPADPYRDDPYRDGPYRDDPYRDDPYRDDPYGTGRYDDDPDPYGRARHPAAEPDGDPTWGRGPAGGWGAPVDDDRRGHRDGAHGDHGDYGDYGDRGYGASSHRDTAYRPARGYDEPGPDEWDDPEPVAYEPGARGPAARRPPPRRGPQPAGRPPWIVIGVAVLVVVAVLVLGFVTPGWFVTRVFDPAAVQAGVARILTDDYGVAGVADVRCPADVRVVTGGTFSCDATIDGDPVEVPVRITDDDGGYEVGRPA